MCGGDHLLWRVVISSSSGSWIDISALSFCAVLIVSVLSFCVCRALSHSVFVLIVVLCLFRILLAVRYLILFLCSLCLCSRFVSVCVCLLIHSVPHRAYARIVLSSIVLHLRFCAHFFLIFCLFACVCLFVLCRIVEET